MLLNEGIRSRVQWGSRPKQLEILSKPQPCYGDIRRMLKDQ
jgi:hypothetical protein